MRRSRLAVIPPKMVIRSGVLTLDSPASLNALSLPMIQILQQTLTRWEQDPAIVCVLLQGAGEKAFCAGGDIRSFYYRKQEASGSELFEYARDFFEQEYRLDHHIHSYRKPLICVADGICMGGGIGLFAGADFRVVTEKKPVRHAGGDHRTLPRRGSELVFKPDAGAAGALARSDWRPLQRE